jgi:hypothetical protein
MCRQFCAVRCGWLLCVVYTTSAPSSAIADYLHVFDGQLIDMQKREASLHTDAWLIVTHMDWSRGTLLSSHCRANWGRRKFGTLALEWLHSPPRQTLAWSCLRIRRAHRFKWDPQGISRAVIFLPRLFGAGSQQVRRRGSSTAQMELELLAVQDEWPPLYDSLGRN